MERHQDKKTAGAEPVRIDRWLWAARFFKTRSSAAKAVSGGLVHCNSQRLKPSRNIHIGDRLEIRRGEYEFEVVVLDLSARRGPAAVARTLYEETEESRLAREARREERRLMNAGVSVPPGRPNKRDRRLIRDFVRGGK